MITIGSSRERFRIAAALALACAVLAGRAAAGEDLYAFYGRIDSGEPFERHARVGEHADVVVHLEALGGELVFWRGSSYLPYWETEAGRWYLDELVPRRGDGEGRRPDRVNTYSRVFITDWGPERIGVLWRYLPEFEGTNPHAGFDATSFVEEGFAIEPDGRVARTLRKGTARYADWVDSPRQLQVLRLTRTGIDTVMTLETPRSPASEPLAGHPIKASTVGAPVASWSFDEGGGDETWEARSEHASRIEGPRVHWKNGVSGTALLFDGYHGAVSLPPEAAPEVSSGLTLEGWVAIGAYPWNWAPVVQRGDDEGYFLGVDGHAQPGMKVMLESGPYELTATRRLERRRWYHLAGTFDASTGFLRLFVDGELAAEEKVPRENLRPNAAPVGIGRGKPRRPVDPVRRNTFVDSYSFDGLIDEVRIHDRALKTEEIARAWFELALPPAQRDAPDLDPRVLPAGENRGTFGAYYTHLEFYEAWDGMWRFGPTPDVVVEFDRSPTKFVFWRGTGYIPMLVNEKGQWYSNEFNETWGTSGGVGCQEPMSDKESYTNHARIVESSPARVVVQWRYPLVDVFHVTANFDEETGWGDWSDWYYHVYPDGVAVKRMRLWTHGRRNHEWHEAMAIFGPDQHPEDIIEKEQTLTLADLEGNEVKYDWIEGPPRIGGDEYRRRKIHLVNYKAEYDPFTIADFIGGDVYGGELTPYAVFPTWNHWPVAQMPSDGRYASFPDRTAHSSLTHAPPAVYREEFGDAPYEERIMMEGMTRKSARELAGLARSWLRAPECTAVSGCRSRGYDPAQRAYLLVAEAPELSLEIDASEERPVEGLCLVVDNWGTGGEAELKLDGVEVAAGPGFRQGLVRDPFGRRRLVVWLGLAAEAPLRFALRGAEPEALSGPVPDPAAWELPPTSGEEPLTARMLAAEASHESGVEYRFGCIGHPELDGGWTKSREHAVTGLAPNTTYAFRVKARTRHLGTETGWSELAELTTGDAPGPLAHWKLDGGSGTAVRDETGAHPGTIEGIARWTKGRDGGALELDGETAVLVGDPGSLSSRSDLTWTAWIRTEQGGAILARSGPEDEWTPGGKVLFVAGGRPAFDVGWVGLVDADADVADGEWHHVALVVRRERGEDRVRFFVDGRPVGAPRRLSVEADEEGLPIKIGHCNEDFPRSQAGFRGAIDDVRWYGYALGAEAVAALHASYEEE